MERDDVPLAVGARVRIGREESASREGEGEEREVKSFG